MTKICSKCKIEKEVNEFSKDRQKNDGLRYYCKKCDKKYYQENKEHIKEYQKVWNEENKEHIKENPEYYKKWCKDNKDKCKERKRKYRARKINADGNFTEKEFNKTLIFYHYRCCACGIDLTKTDFHRDHIQPLSKGGSDYIKNIQPLCVSCNCSKSADWIDYRDNWLQNYAI